MSAREQMQKLAEDSNVSTQFVMDMLDRIIEVVKEECCSGSQRWEVVADFMEKKEPELIQGYTAEQWQEIIDGGYLCEFSDRDDVWWPGFLKVIPEINNCFMSSSKLKDNTTGFYHCRPAQIKGVLRPIWVEPVDDVVWYSFFGDNSHLGDERWCVRNKTGHFPSATRYMEI